MKRPKPLEIDREDIKALRDRAKRGELRAEDAGLVEALAETVVVLSEAVEQKGSSIRRLLRMLFGSKTESKDRSGLPQTSVTSKRQAYARSCANMAWRRLTSILRGATPSSSDCAMAVPAACPMFRQVSTSRAAAWAMNSEDRQRPATSRLSIFTGTSAR